MTDGKVIQFRRGRRVIHERHFLIEIPGSKNREQAEKFVGKKVIWKSPAGKEIIGKISGAHATKVLKDGDIVEVDANKGVVRAIFEKGLPGQAITTKIEVK